MHTRLNPIGTAVLSLLIGGNVGAAALQRPSAGFQGCPVVPDQILNHLRGGFSVPFAGATLNIAFAIQRVTYINGQLQAVTQLTVPSLNTVAMPATPAMPAMPAMPTVSAPPPPAMSATPAVAVPVVGQSASPAPATTGTPGTTPTATQVAAAPGGGSSPIPDSVRTVAVPPAVVTVNGPVTTVQNGAGNTVNLSDLSTLTRQSLLVIQNSLDNQHIQTATVVDATVSNLALYKAMNLSSSITQAVASSLR